jgi:hypothetical protein
VNENLQRLYGKRFVLKVEEPDEFEKKKFKDLSDTNYADQFNEIIKEETTVKKGLLDILSTGKLFHNVK